MAQYETIVDVCDVCGVEDSEETPVIKRRLRINRTDVEAEVCDECYPGEALLLIKKYGRRAGEPARLLVDA